MPKQSQSWTWWSSLIPSNSGYSDSEFSHGLVSVLYSITTLMTLLRGGQKLDKSHTLEQGKLVFTVNVVRHWSKLPRKDVESPSLEILKSGQDPEQPHLAGPALSRGLD